MPSSEATLIFAVRLRISSNGFSLSKERLWPVPVSVSVTLLANDDSSNCGSIAKKLNRPTFSPPTTDSNKQAVPPSSIRLNADTGVNESESKRRLTGTASWSDASDKNCLRSGENMLYKPSRCLMTSFTLAALASKYTGGLACSELTPSNFDS